MNHDMETNDQVLSDEDSEDNLSQTKGSEGVKTVKTTGFRHIVKRIQFAARFSQINQNDRNDIYNEDLKLRSKSVRRRCSKIVCSRQTSHVPSMQGRDSIGGASGDKKSTYIKSEVKFYKADCYYQQKPFVTIDTNTPLNDISYIFKDDWSLETPKIITYVISRREYQSQWKNMKQIQNFKNGIAKAAMSTNMWILTNGLNCGVTSYVCSAVENEICKNKHKTHFKLESLPLLIGIAYEDELTYGHRLSNLDAQKNIVCVENLGYSYGDKFELNPYHSHYIILRDQLNKCNSSEFILKLVDVLVKGEEFYNVYNKTGNSRAIEIPLVSILVEGGPENASLILNLVKNRIPLVVLQGSGGMADIIAYTHMRVWNAFASSTSWDPDYIEEYIKPLVAQKISLQFTELANDYMARNMIREQVIECIRLSKQDGRDYLTILDMYNINSCNLANLSEDLLKALLKSRQNRSDSLKEHFLKDLELTVDWNCANVARNLCSNGATDIDSLKSKFFNVLIRDNREDFVDIFLANDFKVHRFLSPGRLSRLFRAIHEDEFFHTICWETALGQSSNAKQSKFFIENDLNWLIEFCTGLENYVNTEELHHSSMGIYHENDSRSAERKALVLLAIWAVMHNRYKLVEVLWKYTDHPVHLALIISMLFERLSWHVLDTNLKAELRQKSKKFADYASGVLDRCYNENISLAYNILRESIRDFNFMTAVDIAANAQLKQFIAHPCCQKWLTNTFQGNIRLRELGWGFFTVPVYLKILLCSLLIFPMYIWVRFKHKSLDSTMETTEIEDDFDIYDKIYDSEQVNFDSNNGPRVQSTSMNLSSNDISMISLGCYTNKAYEDSQHMHQTRTKRFLHHIHHREVFVKKQPPLFTMIKMMWCSPITKFYTSQLFYVIFLVILSLTTLYPNCGNRVLDSIVCAWSLLLAISCIRHTYILFIKYPSVSIYPKITEIILILAFTTTVASTRLLECHHFYPVYWQKVVFSLAVLYFYYRLITIYLPISPTMGPLLHRVRLMITVDFVNYMRITLVILISNSIVIRALSYPTRDLDLSFVTTVIHQGILALFDSPPKGKINVITDTEKQANLCYMGSIQSSPNSTETTIEEDPFIIYFFVFQFYIILRLIFGPLLFSIFAVTASKWVAEIDSIWKFQRYHLVIDFANRLSLPEPLSLFYYIYLIFYYLTHLFSKSLKSDGKRKNSYNYAAPHSLNIISPEDCYYWKQLAAEYIDTESKKTEESQVIYREWERVQEISEEIEYEKKVLREIKVKIGELEKMMQPGSVREAVGAKERSSSIQPDGSYLSRVSPYAGTTITRFPLPRKCLSWQIAFYAYEPTCYTQSFEEFPPHLRPFVDEDILKMKEDCLRARHSSSRQPPSYKWNDKEIDKNGLVIDRRSWCEGSALPPGAEQPSPLDVVETPSRPTVKYQLENHFLPLNPCGRTGIRGKGALVRWGPNHYCILIITQVIKPKGKSATKQVQLLLERREQSNKLQLIERYINNQDEVYKIFGRAFNVSKEIVQNKLDLRDVLADHFGSTVNVDCRLVQSGYFDSPFNTDNAWMEANVYLVRLEGNFASAELASRVARVEPVEAGTCAEWVPADEQTLAGLLEPIHSQLLSLVWIHAV